MHSLDDMATRRLALLDQRHLRRGLSDGDRRDGIHVERAGRRLLSFCCNDYLNLSQDPRVRAAAIAAVQDYGAGAGASRLVTGNHALLPALERELAAFKGTEAALVFGSGYLANLGVVPALVGGQDLILIDELAHASLLAGARHSDAALQIFRHNDVHHLYELLSASRSAYRHCLVLTEGIFSMDGDLAPLAELSALCIQHDTWLMVDDAHGLGVVGGGRGSAFAAGSPPPAIPLQMGTLSKALGSYGGYLCGSAPVVDWLRNRARTLIYTTGLPPAAVGAAREALAIVARDPTLCAVPVERAARFCSLAGLPLPHSPIVPLLLGGAARALQASRDLQAADLLVTAIRPPTVPRGTARLRFTFSAAHADADIDRLIAVLREHRYLPVSAA